MTLLPPSVESNGHEIRVTFETDYQDGARGFKADYTSGQDINCGGYIPLGDDPTSIQSINCPEAYNPSMEC